MPANRIKVATALEYLQATAGGPCCRRQLLAYGVCYAENTCRISGTMAVALRRAPAVAGHGLLTDLLAAGLEVPADVPRWLNQHSAAVLEILR